MINKNEIQISNKSYINKEFETIYPEVINLVKKLTNKWDPETSNESDPGIVLLKLLSFIGDKLNYNIDKNVLESYMPSATQLSSMSKLCSMMGYDMGYYRASEVDLTFKYIGDKLDDGKSFTLPALTTVVSSNDDSGINYVLIEDVTINKSNEATLPKIALQGDLYDLKILDSTRIQLNNLDDNNRIYFPLTRVAENGIFIYNYVSKEYKPTSFWRRVSNLNTQLPNKKVFKFGFDSSRGLSYVEFPNDISSLINEGLVIKYLVTRGVDGNVKANYLTELISPSSEILANDGNTLIQLVEGDKKTLIINNASASFGGENQESIDEAYNGFKKTIGTFDTLVTCRDYANAIYNMYDSNDLFHVVSNVQVSDRRDDINFSTKLISCNDYGPITLSLPTDKITPYDICLYPLNPINSYTLHEYLKSFEPLQDIQYIVNSLEDSKTISHDYIHDLLTNEDIYLIKNLYKLSVKLTTTYKVNNFERDSIIENVRTALIKKFNAREVDYGYEIPFSYILETIENADNRISNVSLEEPKLITKFITKDNVEGIPLFSKGDSTGTLSGVDYYINLLAKNILEGKISLFDYDNEFNYELGQAQNEGKDMILNNLKSIETHANINLSKGIPENVNDYYRLKENEVVQVVSPSLVTEITYPAYVNYYCNLKDKSRIIKDNSNYQLGIDEVLILVFNDSENKQKVVKYSVGDIIRPIGFDLRDTSDLTNDFIAKSIDENTLDRLDLRKYLSNKDMFKGKLLMLSLKLNESIEKRVMNEFSLTQRTPCYWLRNNSDNLLFKESDLVDDTYRTMLNEGEYFFYTDGNFKELVSLGSGTIIECANIRNDWRAPIVDKDEVIEGGLLELKNKWVYLNLNSDAKMTVKETSILTLTEDDLVATSEINNLTNELKPLVGDLSYKISTEDEVKDLERIDLNDSINKWKIKSRLDINSSKTKSQTIAINQVVKFTNKEDKSIILDSANQKFNLNETFTFVGSDNIDVSSYDIVNKIKVYPLSVYNYKQMQFDVERNDLGFFNLKISKNKVEYTFPKLNKKSILLLYWAPKDDKSSGLQIQTTKQSTIRFYNSSTSFVNQLNLNDGINIIETSINIDNLKFNTSSDGTSKEGVLIVGTIDFYNELNHKLGIDSFSNKVEGITSEEIITKLMSKLKSMSEDSSGVNKFYYNNKIDNSKIIEIDDMTSPLAFYDYNNVANKFTLSEIDFSNSSIDVVRSSRL